MQRYNRSFIGLMETCNNGEWILAKDYDDKVSEMLIEYNKLQEKHIDIQTRYHREVDNNIKLLNEKSDQQDIKFFTIFMVGLVIFVPLFLRLVI